MNRLMNILFPKKTRLKDVVMANPPPPPVKFGTSGYQPIKDKLDTKLPPKGGSGVSKPIPPKSITQKEYFKGTPDA